MPSKTRCRFVLELLASLVALAASSVGSLATNRTAAIQAFCQGYIHRQKGDLGSALAYFTRAFQLHEDFALALGERALVHEALGNLRQAALDDEREFDLLTEIAQEGGERRKQFIDSRQIAVTLADLARFDPDDAVKRHALASWMQTYGPFVD